MPSSAKRKKIEAVCDLCQGTHTKFNQSWQDIKAQRQLAGFYNDKTQSFNDKTYVGGMCQAMSMYWLALRSRGEKSFFDWLKPNGTWDKGAINVLVVKTAMYKNSKNGYVPAEDHKKFVDRFFAHYNLSRQGTPESGLDGLLAAIDRKTPGFHLIGLSGPSSGHAVAAQVTAGGASAFFDPNYGEYAFESPLFLGSFMKAFMTHSEYRTKYTSGQSMETFS